MEELPFIGDSKVVAHTPYGELLPTLEEAFVAYGNDSVSMPDKTYVDVDKYNGDFRSMPAYVDADKWEASGVKWVNVHPDNEKLDTVMGTVVYTDPETGRPLATIAGTELTRRRTAAVAAIATDYLAPSPVYELGVLGAGKQSYQQVRAIEHIRDFNEIFVSDIDADAVKAFKDEFDDYKVTWCSPDELTDVDILCTTTPSEHPVIDEFQNSNIHINAMGADAPQKQEFDSSVLIDDELAVIVDSYSQAMHSGEISQSIESGELTRDDIHASLSDVIMGVTNNRELASTPTLFDSTGLAIQDIAAAQLVFTNTVE